MSKPVTATAPEIYEELARNRMLAIIAISAQVERHADRKNAFYITLGNELYDLACPLGNPNRQRDCEAKIKEEEFKEIKSADKVIGQTSDVPDYAKKLAKKTLSFLKPKVLSDAFGTKDDPLTEEELAEAVLAATITDDKISIIEFAHNSDDEELCRALFQIVGEQSYYEALSVKLADLDTDRERSLSPRVQDLIRNPEGSMGGGWQSAPNLNNMSEDTRPTKSSPLRNFSFSSRDIDKASASSSADNERPTASRSLSDITSKPTGKPLGHNPSRTKTS